MAESRAVGLRVVRRLVIPMRCGEPHAGRAHEGARIDRLGPEPDPPAPTVAPSCAVRVPPAALAAVVDHLPVRPPAALTAARARPNRITAESCGQSMD